MFSNVVQCFQWFDKMTNGLQLLHVLSVFVNGVSTCDLVLRRIIKTVLSFVVVAQLSSESELVVCCSWYLRVVSDVPELGEGWVDP